MKKILSMLLTIAVLVSTIVIPVSADIINLDIASGKVATGWYNNNGTNLSTFVEGYDAAKMTDGNDDTFVLAKVQNYSHHMLVVDLGRAYDITKIRIKAPTTAEAQAVQTAAGQTTTSVNTAACLFVADKVPSYSDFNGVNITSGITDVVRVNTDAQSLSGIDKTYQTIGNVSDGNSLGKHRYVGVFAPYSYGFAVSSLEVYADADLADQKVATGWYNSNGTELTSFIEGYDAAKMTDGDDGTFALAKVQNYSHHMLVVDLGDEYNIAKIRIKAPTTAEAQAVQTAAGQTTTSVNTAACLFVADKVPSYSDFNGVNITSGITDVVRVNTDAQSLSGIDKTYQTIGRVSDGDSLGRHRYVGIFAPYSYGFAVSSLEVYADDVVEDDTNESKQFYVSPSGDDNNDGSANSPFKTVERARDEVRKFNQDMTSDIIVNIAGGRYELENTLELVEEDSGYNGFDVIYRGDESVPTLSGGIEIDGWQDSGDGIWTTTVADTAIENIRDLYVNETPTNRASSSGLVFGVENYLPSGSTYSKSEGFYVNKPNMDIYSNQEDIQLSWTVGWKTFNLNIESIEDDPSNSDRVLVKMENPAWNSSMEIKTHDWPEAPSWNIGFRVENAYELLDEAGEFYFDKDTRVLSYIPREGEDMNTATVICPKLDKIMTVSGAPDTVTYNQINYAKNIRFENIRFAHSTFSALDDSPLYAFQCEALRMSNVPAMTTPGAVELTYADSVDIEGCVFFGIESVALALVEAVKNCNFKSNVFTDLGCGAFLVGRQYHYRTVNAWTTGQWRDKRANVSYRKPWTTSNQRSAAFTSSINSTFENEDSLAAHGIWRNEPNAAADGIKSWVKMDLLKEYDIASIFLSFKDYGSETISEEERRNFEVLLSNDEDFATYETVHIQTEALSDSVYAGSNSTDEQKNSIMIDCSNVEGTYRYVMVRKTVAEAFAMNLMRVYSFDQIAIGEHGVCTNDTFENNYIARIGNLNKTSSAITAYDANGLKILHNEIEDVPYTGISIGYAWSNTISQTSGNNEIKYNSVKDFEMIGNDGGGIYTISNQIPYNSSTGTYDETQGRLQIEGNYIENQYNVNAALYPDSGSAFIDFKDNVLQNVDYSFMAAGSTIRDVTVSNTYTTDDQHQNNGTNVTVGDFVEFTANQLPTAAMEIKLNAGLEDTSEYIRSRIPDNEIRFLQGPDGSASYIDCRKDVYYAPDRTEFMRETVTTMLEKGNYGNLPWQYDMKYKNGLNYWMSRLDDADNRSDDKDRLDGDLINKWDFSVGHMYEFQSLMNEYYKAADSVTHMSYDDMINFCETKREECIEGTSLDQYPESALTAFDNAIAAAKSASHSTEYEEYCVVKALEEAYEALESAKLSADIKDVYVCDGETELDYDTKTATVTVSSNTDLSSIVPQITAMSNATIQTDYSVEDFSEPVSITLQNNDDTSITSTWIVSIVNEELIATDMTTLTTDTVDWYNANPNTSPYTSNDSIHIPAWFTPTMYKTPLGSRLAFDVSAESADAHDGINFIINAKACEDLEPEGYYPKNTYYMLSLKDQNLTLYKVNGGVATELGSVNNVGFEYGTSYNTFTVKVVSSNNTESVTVQLNGDGMFDLPSVTNGVGDIGYFGVYSKNANVRIAAAEYVENENAVNVEVAGGKFAYANWHYQNNSPYNLTDGDETTNLVIYDTGHTFDTTKTNALYSYIDLGREYPLNSIELTFADETDLDEDMNKNVSVYVTNTRPDGSENIEKTLVSQENASFDSGTTILTLDGMNSYRYILVEKQNASGIAISEVSAYAYIVESLNETYLYDVARNKASFGSTDSSYTYIDYMPAKATDDNLTTGYRSGVAVAETQHADRFVVDLGAEYNIEGFTLLAESLPTSEALEILLSEDGTFDDSVSVWTQPDDGSAFTNEPQYIAITDETILASKYRYVAIDKETLGDIAILDFGVIGRVGKEESLVTSSMPVTMISGGKSVIALDTLKEYTPGSKTPAEITNRNYSWGGYVSSRTETNQEDQFIYIDLGAEYSVPYVTVLTDKGYMGMVQNFQIVGTNTEPTAETEANNFTVLYEEGAGSTSYITNGRMRTYEMNPEYSGNTYRYIGVRKPCSTNSSDTRIVIKEMEVYTYAN